MYASVACCCSALRGMTLGKLVSILQYNAHQIPHRTIAHRTFVCSDCCAVSDFVLYLTAALSMTAALYLTAALYFSTALQGFAREHVPGRSD